MPSRVEGPAVAEDAWPDPSEALERLADGGLVAFPTETVWGLAADACNAHALRALRSWKGRADSHPIAVLVTGYAAVERLGFALGPVGRRLADAFWPGPLTLVVRSMEGAVEFAPGVLGAGGAVGFRCSPHPAAATLARAAAERGLGPLTATSFNRTGEAPAPDREIARNLCTGSDGPLLWPRTGPDSAGEGVSSVVDVTGRDPVVLRAGAISIKRLTGVVGVPINPASEELSRR